MEESREIVIDPSFSNEDFNEEAGNSCDVYKECCQEACSPSEIGAEEC